MTSGSAAAASSPAVAGRLDVLVIITDQQSATALSCADNPDLDTPAIDSIATRGVRFSRAYCASPLCTPSRASMLTGRLPSEVGVDDNVATVPDSFPTRTLGRRFADAGYDTAWAGKWHVPGVVHDNAPGTGDAVSTSGFTQVHRDAHAGLAEACGRYLAGVRDRGGPFLLVASFVEPHGISEWAREQAPPSGEVEPVDWRELPSLPTNFAPGSEEPAAVRRLARLAPRMHPVEGWDETRWRRYRHAYFRLCERVDHEVGQVLAALDESGLADTTLVVFTADHGDMQGAHRWNQKKLLYDEAAGVPFIVAAPGADEGAVRDELVSVGLDLLPTLCDYGAVDLDEEWAGRSVRPLVEAGDGPQPSWRSQVVAETEWTVPTLGPAGETARLSARMLRTDRYKYVCHSWGRHREQLHDLGEDPGEMVNLATSGRHQEVLADHRRRLSRHCAEVGDGFVRHVPDPGAAPH